MQVGIRESGPAYDDYTHMHALYLQTAIARQEISSSMQMTKEQILPASTDHGACPLQPEVVL